MRCAAGLIGFCATLLFCGAIKAAEPAIVVVFGDSLSNAWVRSLDPRTARQLRLINESRPGRPTDAAGEFDQMLARQPGVDLLVIALGTNDSGDSSAATVPRAVENIRKMVRAARKAAGDELPVLVVGPPNMSGSTAPQRVRKLQELNRGFRDLAAKLGCRFLTLYGVLPDSSLAADGTHPDAAGNALIAKVLLPELLAAVRRRQTQ